MKKSIQPKDYRFVVFSDEQAKFSFLTRSTAKSEETIKWEDGKEYPLVKVQISSASHPFFREYDSSLQYGQGQVQSLFHRPRNQGHLEHP